MASTPVPSVLVRCVCPALLAIELLAGGRASAGKQALDRAARLGAQPGESSRKGLDARSGQASAIVTSPPATGPVRLAQGSVRLPFSSGDSVKPAPAGPGRQARKTAVSPSSPIQVFRATCVECHDNDGRGE